MKVKLSKRERYAIEVAALTYELDEFERWSSPEEHAEHVRALHSVRRKIGRTDFADAE